MEKIIFKSDLYDLNFFIHLRVRTDKWKSLSEKAVRFNEHWETFYEAFRVEFYIIIKPMGVVEYRVYINDNSLTNNEIRWKHSTF
jgi:hypothetical protein